MPDARRILYNANYLLAWVTLLSVAAFIMDKPFWWSLVFALAGVAVVAILFKAGSPDIDEASPHALLALGHNALLLAHVMFWPTVIAINVLEGESGMLVSMVGGMLFVPGGVIFYIAGLVMIEITRPKWRELWH